MSQDLHDGRTLGRPALEAPPDQVLGKVTVHAGGVVVGALEHVGQLLVRDGAPRKEAREITAVDEIVVRDICSVSLVVLLLG